jgi:hypothetical protein
MLTSLVMAAVSLWALAVQAQVLDSTERARAKQMLNEIKGAIRSNLGGKLDPLAAGKLFPIEWK